MTSEKMPGSQLATTTMKDKFADLYSLTMLSATIVNAKKLLADSDAALTGVEAISEPVRRIRSL